MSEWLGPLLAIGRRWIARGRPTRPEEWKRVLLLGADHIGDVLYRTVGLKQLAASFPKCEFVFAVNTATSVLLERNPAVSLLCMERELERLGVMALAKTIRCAAVDTVICYDTTGYMKPVIATALAGVPNCVAYTHKGFSGLVTHAAPIRYPQPFVAYFRDLVEYLTKVPVTSLRPEVILSRGDIQRALKLETSFGLSSSRWVVASVTSRQRNHPSTQRQMIASLVEVKRRAGVAIVLSGSASDEALLRKLAQEGGLECFYQTGRLSLLEAIAFFKLAAVAFCLDSGPRHMANAAGIPVVFCRNLQFSKVEAGAYLESESDIAPDCEHVSYASSCIPPLFSVEDAVAAILKHLV